MIRALAALALFAALPVHAQDWLIPSNVGAMTSANTYYVCAKAAGGICVYNGDGGTMAKPSDSHPCTTKAAPCATIAGVAAKINGKILTTITTIQLADTAGTGTDCYRPNNTRIALATVPAPSSAVLDINETQQADAYPTAYLYLVGNTTSPSNVKLTGAKTCSGTTGNDVTGIRFGGMTVRVRGIQGQYFAGGNTGPDNGAFEFFNSHVYAEDLYYIGDATQTATLLVPWRSVMRLGSSLQWSVRDGNFIDCMNYSTCGFITPLGRANIHIHLSGKFDGKGGLIAANEDSHVDPDGLTLSVDGSGTAIVWIAYDHSTIYWTDSVTFTAPAWGVTVDGANLTYMEATDNSYINDGCRTVGQVTCKIGASAGLFRMARAQRGSYVKYITSPVSASNIDLAEDSRITGPVRAFVGYPDTTFSNLGALANGSVTYCSNCTFANPCASGGTGAIAKRLNGQWRCD